MNDLLQVELMLLNWAKTATGGAKVIFQVSPEDLEKFESMTLAKKGQGGQRFMAALALVADDEQPQTLPLGPLGRLAAIWCRDPSFHYWLTQTYPGAWKDYAREEQDAVEIAKLTVCELCGVQSRKDLDYSVDGRKMFNELVRRPYMAHLGESA